MGERSAGSFVKTLYCRARLVNVNKHHFHFDGNGFGCIERLCVNILRFIYAITSNKMLKCQYYHHSDRLNGPSDCRRNDRCIAHPCFRAFHHNVDAIFQSVLYPVNNSI